MRRKPKCGRQTDGHGDSSIPPPLTSFGGDGGGGGGIKIMVGQVTGNRNNF